MTREKNLILASVTSTTNLSNNKNAYGFNNYQTQQNNKEGGYSSKKFSESTALVDVNLGFNFDLWVSN